ncbi:MAG: RNA 2'-phosphotransferase [Chitinophagaceae bacterium]|nr:RNA 2'-phosphotransferase [Chitinophagaceae bacterium]
METSDKTSKLISYWLRHNPGDAGLIVDDFGWASVDQLLYALHSRNIQLDFSQLLQLQSGFDKVRWEMDEQSHKIRATHGHSFPVLLDDKVKIPPETLYHGTAVKNISNISAEGLLPMARQFVHLSETIETAITVGKRHGKPILIEVDTKELINDGQAFFQTSDNVWLTTAIAIDYLSFRPWHPAIDESGFAIAELRREIGDRTSHFLYPHLNNLKLAWRSSASDDTLFKDEKTGECFMVHLTYTKKKQEIEGWPHIEKYRSIEEWFETGLWTDQQYFYNLE